VNNAPYCKLDKTNNQSYLLIAKDSDMKIKLLILLLIYSLMLSFALPAEKRIQINISWKELFPDHLERVCVFMKDSTVFRFTSHYEKMVHLNSGSVEEDLKKHDYKIEDIEIIIHNHFIDHKFSENDEKQYRALKSKGFKGRFLLYCHRDNKIYSL